MRWAPAVMLAALAVAAPATAPAAPRPVGCASGFTVHEERGVRLFGAYRGEDLALYACTARRARPVRLWSVSPATTPELVAHGRTGSRLALSLEEFADGGNGVWVGWFDVRTGRRALREVRGPSSRPDPEDEGSDFTPHPDALAVGRDGSVAYAFAAGGATYEVFHRRAAGRGLERRERRVARVPVSELEPLSLGAARRGATWRTRGEERSVPLAPGGDAAPPPAASAGQRVACDDGEGLFSDAAVRVFAAAGGVHACRLARGARPARLAPAGARLSRFVRAGRALGFVVRQRGRVAVGSLGLRSRILRTAGIGGAPQALAVGTDGGVAYVGGAAGARALTYLPVAGARFGSPRELARTRPAELDPKTLRLTPAAATWRTVGTPRRAAFG